MKIFEFQFNPKARQDRFFRAFSFEPQEGMQERGSMYIVGELANALPTNANFLDRLAALLQQEYYDAEKQNESISQRLKNTLKKANEFLAEEAKNGNVDWLGNLHFLVLLFVPTPQGHTLYFTRTGGMKLWMARNGSLVDAGKSIEAAKNEEGSARVFGNVGSGKVLPQDRIAALTSEAFDFFSKENFLQTVTQFKEERQFKNAFKAKEKEMASLSGILFFVLIEASVPVEPNDQGDSARAFPKPKIPALLLPITIPRVKPSLPAFAFARKKLSRLVVSEAKKRASLLALLLFVLLLGFAIFGDETGNTPNTNRRPQAFPEEELTEEMRSQYKITEISAPEIAATVDTSELAQAPQRFILLDGAFYLFRPSSREIVTLDPASNSQTLISATRDLRFGDIFANTFVFFAEPSILLSFNEARGWEERTISFPQQFSPEGMKTFAGTMYFFDGSLGQIVKVVQGKGELWLEATSPKKPLDTASIAIDGSIWALKSNGEIQRYFKGVYQETLPLDIFPALTSAQDIETRSQSEYLYILDNAETRVLVLDKTGGLIAQYKSEAFKNASDLAVSANGQVVYVLAGSAIYEVDL